MAASTRKPELKDFETKGDSQGAVIDFQQRNMDYQKALREWEQGQKGGEKRSEAVPTKPGAPAPTTGGGATGTPGGGTPAPAATGGAPAAAGGFNLNVKGSRIDANESKGALNTTQAQKQHQKLANQWVNMYNERMPALRNYDELVQKQVDTLIGETMPQVQDMFRQAGEQYGFAKEFYAEAKGYDTEERRGEARGKAMTDVRTAGDSARQNALASLERYGVDPSQSRGAALDANLRLNTALEQARAAEEAETGVEERGYQRRKEGLGAVMDAAGRSADITATGAGILRGNVSAQGEAADSSTRRWGTQANWLEGAGRAIGDKTQAKAAQQASIAAQEAAKEAKSGANAAGIGSLIGTVAGGALGAYAGGPMGMQMGMQMGGALGGGLAGGQMAAPDMSSASGLATSWGSPADPTATEGRR